MQRQSKASFVSLRSLRRRARRKQILFTVNDPPSSTQEIEESFSPEPLNQDTDTSLGNAVDNACFSSLPLDVQSISTSVEDVSVFTNPPDEVPLNNRLAALAVKHNMSREAVGDLSELLRSLGHNVSKDARTILKTPRKKLQSDCFVHLGLIKNLMRKLKFGLRNNVRYFELQVNIDGTPIFNSSSMQLWPILCRISNGIDSSVFVIALYYGKGKPTNLEEFLNPFIDELIRVEQHGICLAGTFYYLKSTAFICDAPARQFVKSTQGHMGYHACERCTVVGVSGESQGRRMFISMSAEPRTDADFRVGKYVGGHQTTKNSPLFRSKIDFIRCFVLDYMHCVCLGTFKRFLSILKEGQLMPDDKVHVLSPELNAKFDALIGKLKLYLPFEFNRKGRSLADLCRWKAVEFRLFFLYTGLIILREVLPADKYANYLKFFVAMRYLLSPSPTDSQIEYSNLLLRKYVHDFAKLFGIRHLVFNFHCLIHLADDAKYFKTSINNISAFPFESFLGKIKRLVRGSQKPLAQITRRIIEIEVVQDNSLQKNETSNVRNQLRANTKGNSFLMLANKNIYKITSISSSGVFAYPLTVSPSANFFTSPMPSTDLDIFVCDSALHGAPVRISDEDLLTGKKCVGLPYTFDETRHLLIIPLLHLM